ncbi:MAG: hypothetical protein FWG96_00235 [Methanomassiliicoccaceae archaeon]|nr:hypothetical protein [Methanomassiliicoccaceae archaeon]
MYCRSCGNQLNEGQSFCDKCGVRADGAEGGPGPQYVVHINEKSSGVAAVLSFLWAGAGQIYVGRIGRGLALMFSYLLIYAVLFVVGFVIALEMESFGGFIVLMISMGVFTLAFWIWNIYDAYKLSNEYNDYLRSHGKRPW